MPQSDAPPWLSIVVPLKNEAENIDFVTQAIVAACEPLSPYEIIYVDDGSDDDTAARVLALAARHPQVRLVQHAASAGQSAAVHSGVTLARGTAICTLDGDGQNPPSEIPKLAARLDAGPEGRTFPEGVALVAGQRVGRQQRIQALGVARRQRHPPAPAERRHPRHRLRAEALSPRRLPRPPYFDHMHRYLPALVARDGWRTLHQDVAHASRHAGRSNYSNLARALVGIYDLFGVTWLIKRRKKARPIEVTPEGMRREA